MRKIETEQATMNRDVFTQCDGCQKPTWHIRRDKLLRCKNCGRRRTERGETRVRNVFSGGRGF